MLTASQLATLKTDISGQSTLTAAVAAKDWPTVAAFYAEASSPAVTIWRADVKPSEIVAAITYTELVALTSPTQFALQVLLQPGVVDATSANVRAAFSAIFGDRKSTRLNSSHQKISYAVFCLKK